MKGDRAKAKVDSNDNNANSSINNSTVMHSITSSMAQIDMLFMALGIESIADLSSSVNSTDVTRGIENSMNLTRCKKIQEKSDNKSEEDEAEKRESQSENKTPTPKMHQVRRRGVRRGTVDSCNAEEFRLLGAKGHQNSKKARSDEL